MSRNLSRFGIVVFLALPFTSIGQVVSIPPKKVTPAPAPPRSEPAPPQPQQQRAAPQQPQYSQPQQQQPRATPQQPQYNSGTPQQRSNPNSASSTTPNGPGRPAPSSGPTSSSRTGRAAAPAPGPKPPTTYRPGSAAPSGGSAPSITSGSKTGAVIYKPGSVSPSTPTSETAAVKAENGVTIYTPRSSPVAAPAVHPVPAPAASPAVSSPRPSATSPATKTAGPKTLDQINAARATMHGINQRPLPPGVVSNHPNGGLTVKTVNGSQYTVRANGTLKSYSRGKQTVNFQPNGRIASIHNPGIDIQRGAAGQRTIGSHRPDGSVLASTAPHRGYLERTVVSGTRTTIQRTYFAGGKTFTRAYLGYSYAGLTLPHYVPASYYSAEFYGWAYYDWATPATYAWDSAGQLLCESDGSYFTPNASYASGFAWLADLILRRTLADGCADQQAQDAGSAPSDDPPTDTNLPAGDDTLYAQADTPIGPELKGQIAAEVQRQIAYESAVVSGAAELAVGEFPASLKSGNRVFVAANTLDVSTPDQQACVLTPGDVLRLDASPPEGSATANLRVAGSHRQDCPVGTVVTLSLLDLQEMQNSLRVQLDAGLEALHAGHGEGGLPPAPAFSLGATQPSPLGVPEADPNVGALLNAQQQEASRVETAAVLAVFPAKQQ